MASFEFYLIAGASLLLFSVMASKATTRIGVPSLLVFIAVGMLAGSEGIGRIHFDNAAHAQMLGVVALIYILFAGGLGTELKEIKPIIRQGTSLGTIGVLVTSLLTGTVCKWLLHFSWLEGFLVGAIVSSTDAAAVFTVLRERGIRFKGKVQPLLEFESGVNDPMAVLLTIGLLDLIGNKMSSPLGLVGAFFLQISIGSVTGFFSGKAIAWILNRLKLSAEGLYPVITLSFVMLVYGVTQKLGGSGFLAVYLTGLILGSENFVNKSSLTLFHEGIGWLMQIAMFLSLGLLVFPSQLVPVIQPGLFISAFLILMARPLAVFISLFGTSFNTREKLMIAWVGLRGSVPIILATYPLLAGIAQANTIFNLVFFIVITSVLIQGSLISKVADFLKVKSPSVTRFRYPIEYTPSANMKSDLKEFEVKEESFANGKSLIELGLPSTSLVVLIQREGNIVIPKGGTHLLAGDTMLVLAEKALAHEVQNCISNGNSG